MSSPTRTIVNVWKAGIRSAWRQMQYIGDTKFGRLVGEDKFGNRYFENNEELPLRTRWVDYKVHDFDAAHIQPGWHGWISYMYDKPPTEDRLLTQQRGWERPGAVVNMTATRGAYKPYNTVKPKVASAAWIPQAVERAS